MRRVDQDETVLLQSEDINEMMAARILESCSLQEFLALSDRKRSEFLVSLSSMPCAPNADVSRYVHRIVSAQAAPSPHRHRPSPMSRLPPSRKCHQTQDSTSCSTGNPMMKSSLAGLHAC